jgi:hypothetical protein
MKCHSCGKEYTAVASHWALSSSCDYPELSEKQVEIVRGLMFGDGSLDSRGSTRTTRLYVTSITKEFLNHLSTEFPQQDCESSIKITAEENASRKRESGFSPDAKVENYSDVYKLLITNPNFDMFTDWYEEEGLVWPDDVPMSPTTLKYWYCSDGSLATSNGAQIQLYSKKIETESGRKKARRYFEDIPVPEPSFSGGDMYWCNIDDVKQVLDYMGQPLPGFEYKWNIHG